jgi:hypothetical protein
MSNYYLIDLVFYKTNNRKLNAKVKVFRKWISDKYCKPLDEFKNTYLKNLKVTEKENLNKIFNEVTKFNAENDISIEVKASNLDEIYNTNERSNKNE